MRASQQTLENNRGYGPLPASRRAGPIHSASITRSHPYGDGAEFHSKENMNTINRKLSILTGIVLIACTLGCASTAKQEGTGEYVDDTAITAKVKAAIFNEPTLKSAEINVETFKGVVQLSGFVSSPGAERTAVAVARDVGGVKSVKNDMRLK
jgi:hypothetical protein